MKYLPQLFESNRRWAAGHLAADPKFFDRLCEIQKPDYLWIGCADSRVPANEIVGLAPGEMFVQRNVANLVRNEDLNCMAVVEYAVNVLAVKHLIVCGHYGCGGVRAVLDGNTAGTVGRWLEPLVALRDAHRQELETIADPSERWSRLCEINVIDQVEHLRSTPLIREAKARGAELMLHGWIYDLRDGLLRDLEVSVKLGQ